MQRSKFIPLVAVALIASASFLAGRYSAPSKPQETPATETGGNQSGRLTALSPRSKPRLHDLGRGVATPRGGAPRDADEENAATASMFLAEIASEVKKGGAFGYKSAIYAWLEKDPEEVIKWLASGDDRSENIKVLFAIWAEQEIETAEAWLAENPNFDGFGSAAAGLALWLTYEDEPEHAFKWLAYITDPLTVARVWSEAGKELYIEDSDAALQGLAESGLPEAIQNETIRKWRTHRAAVSESNAQSVASVYSAAIAAGATFDGSSTFEIVWELVAGVRGADSYSDTVFHLPNLDDTEIDAALANLGMVGNDLIYFAAPLEPWNELSPRDRDNAAKRTAQTLASTVSAASAAGATFNGASTSEIALEIIRGVVGSDRFSNTLFQVPSVSKDGFQAALRNLQLSDDGLLTYALAE